MTGAKEVKNLWSVIAMGPDYVIELRGLSPKGSTDPKPAQIKHFRAASYASLAMCKEAVEKAALDLNRQGFNVYTVMNPIRPDFAGQGAAKDVDIRYRDLLLIDIDRVGDTSVPANQDELDAARALARKVRDDMAARGWIEPVVVMSGNGYHLYYVS